MSNMWNELYRVVPVTADTTSCLIIPSTYGCCEIPLVAEIVKPCEHDKIDEHWVETGGYAAMGGVERKRCDGAGLEDT